MEKYCKYFDVLSLFRAKCEVFGQELLQIVNYMMNLSHTRLLYLFFPPLLTDHVTSFLGSGFS